MRAADDVHGAIVLGSVVQHDHYRGEVAIGVGEEGEVLVPAEAALALPLRLGGELGVLELDVGAEQGDQARGDARVAGQVEEGRVADGELERVDLAVRLFPLAVFGALKAWRRATTSSAENRWSMTM